MASTSCSRFRYGDAEAEEQVGPLPTDYRDFLKHANGWQGFFLSTDLFGTTELVSDKSKETLAREDVRDLLRDAGVDLQDAIAIGCAAFDTDVFVAVSPSSRVLPSAILWFAGGEIERHTTFGEFFDAMVNYNARVARKVIEQVQQ